MTLRVLYVIDSLAPGGAERSLAALAPSYRSLGVELDVAYLVERRGLQDPLRHAGARLFSIDGSAGRFNRIRRARKLIAERRPDLVHTTLFEADLIGRIAASHARIPVVSSLVNESYSAEQSQASILHNAKLRGAQIIDAATARLVSRFHAVSDSVAAVMSRRLRIPKERIDVVPRGRDPLELGRRTEKRRLAARRTLKVGPEELVVFAAARHETQKGLTSLIDAFPTVLREVPTARLIIAGREGSQTARLHGAVERFRLNGHARFLGPRDDVPDLLCAADAFVLPSLWEGLPGAVLEAMALEVPIVASDIAGVRAAVGSAAAARLVPVNRPDLISRAIVECLRDRDDSAQRARVARERFLEGFTIDRVAKAMVGFYERALAQN